MTALPSPPYTLRTSEVARLLGVHPDTVIQLAEEGVLPAWRLRPHSPRRFRREDVEALLRDAHERMSGAAA